MKLVSPNVYLRPGDGERWADADGVADSILLPFIIKHIQTSLKFPS